MPHPQPQARSCDPAMRNRSATAAAEQTETLGWDVVNPTRLTHERTRVRHSPLTHRDLEAHRTKPPAMMRTEIAILRVHRVRHRPRLSPCPKLRRPPWHTQQ